MAKAELAPPNHGSFQSPRVVFNLQLQAVPSHITYYQMLGGWDSAGRETAPQNIQMA